MLIGKSIKGLINEQHFIPSKNGAPDIRVRVFRPHNDKPLPCMLFYHGGGYMVGLPEKNLERFASYIRERPCVIIAPDYRKSLKHPFPAGFNDCYDTLLWAQENAESLNIDPSQFILAGNSAGGGLVAAVALKARDTHEVKIAFQMPLYPMIDHRQITDSAKNMINVPIWNARINKFAWDIYLKDVEQVPAYASPTLEENYGNLPPTITFIGDLDPFLDETIHYVKALRAENIPVEFEIYKGAYHAFEKIKPNASISKKTTAFELNAYANYYDTYFSTT